MYRKIYSHANSIRVMMMMMMMMFPSAAVITSLFFSPYREFKHIVRAVTAVHIVGVLSLSECVKQTVGSYDKIVRIAIR